MAISRQKKEAVVAELTERLSQSQAIILTDYRGLNVSQLSQLRDRLQQKDSTFQVAKNTLIRLALERAERPVPTDLLEGPTALAFVGHDLSGPARVLLDFARETNILTVKGALLDHEVLGPDGVERLATIPSRSVLLAQALGGLQYPPTALLRLLSSPVRNLVYVLNARAQEMQEAGA